MAVKAAGRLVADIDAVEGEIESFKRNADAEQMLRLERKLDGMNAAGLNSDTDRQMHALLVNERELLRRVSSQLEEATKRRSRLTALLSALWREMESLRDDSSQSPRDQSEVLQKIRGLCEEADGAG
jgi:chromosome segregation ATPase